MAHNCGHLGVSQISPNPLMGKPGASRWAFPRLGDLAPIWVSREIHTVNGRAPVTSANKLRSFDEGK
ncbi:MAG: hypothetical protein QOF15_1679 [Mycobacterium sp.]|jgi:hypothetical protein|nr:hypothetical protein [Mycobacterium sp.]